MTAMLLSGVPSTRLNEMTAGAVLLAARNARATLSSNGMMAWMDAELTAIQHLGIQYQRAVDQGQAADLILPELQARLALMREMASITFWTAMKLQSLFGTQPRGITPEQREVLGGFPLLLARIDAREAAGKQQDRDRDERLKVENAEREAAEEAANVTERKTTIIRLVSGLAARGVALHADTHGLTAKPSALLMDSDRALIQEHTGELVELLGTSGTFR